MWKFIKSATDQTNWLRGHAKEVCFIGRSNVGKSSLINALANNKKMARVSNTPGRTRLINFFQEDNRIYVDLPGYGWARMSKQNQNQMLKMIEYYFDQRQELIKVFLLIDSKIGPTSDDMSMINYLQRAQKDFFIVMTKSDKANQSQLFKSTEKIKGITKNFLIVSAKNNKNIIKLSKIIKREF